MEKASHSEIAKRAYAIWEREGRPDGRDFDHWLAAEREVGGSEPGAATESTPMQAQQAAAAGAAAAIKRKPTRASTRKKTTS